MSETSDETGTANNQAGTGTGTDRADKQLHEAPEVGLIADEDLPADLQPTDDNPLAQDPDQADSASEGGPGSGEETQVEGMPDLQQPG
ncbi:hypothetical protein [Nocardioides mesophilus]|uniref:Uncharacterized protein n=1 Tax=Nocardioides mesophilus TaxID=433659 RepID=A0A7G9RFW0_9ACTN|nr:hypothetical protein [Nocardioides mesophilus]QNN54485.1 hypothetical protein H9L09_09335 [Nocardioides mesophilus]